MASRDAPVVYRKGREAMRRGLLLSLAAGLLGLLSGCRHNCQGRCDCQVSPMEHCTPSPYVKPGSNPSSPIQPVVPAPAQ